MKNLLDACLIIWACFLVAFLFVCFCFRFCFQVFVGLDFFVCFLILVVAVVSLFGFCLVLLVVVLGFFPTNNVLL